MTIQLDDRLAELATAWDAAAAPVAVAEIRGRAELHRTETATPPVSPSPARRRSWPMVVLAVAAAAGVVAFAAVGWGDSARRTIGPVGTEPATSSAPTVVSSSDSDATDPTSLPAPATDAELAEVAGAVNGRLSVLNGFRATVTLSRSQQQPSVDNSEPVVTAEEDLVNVVTLLSDGSIWSEGAAFLWTSYDATTGVSRGAVAGQDGVTRYEESVGWADNSTPLLLLFGYYPVMHFDMLGDPTLAASTSHLGRAAWRITSTFAGGISGSPDDMRLETFTIDQQSGLVVAYELRQTIAGRVGVTEARLDDLVLDVALPAEFPGSFPEGADVQRSGDPSGFTSLTVSAAAAAFGAGFVAPALADDVSPRVLLTVSEFPAEGDSPAGAFVQVMIEWHTGFVSSSFGLSKSVITDGSLPPAGVLAVDGAVCPSTDGIHCDYYDAPSIVTQGAWAGSPSLFDGPRVSITHGPIQGTAAGPTPEAALVIANSLTTVEF